MLAALRHNGPVIFLEHKLLSESCLEFLGSGGRRNIEYDVPTEGTRGLAPRKWEPLPIVKAAIRREGTDITVVSSADAGFLIFNQKIWIACPWENSKIK